MRCRISLGQAVGRRGARAGDAPAATPDAGLRRHTGFSAVVVSLGACLGGDVALGPRDVDSHSIL